MLHRAAPNLACGAPPTDRFGVRVHFKKPNRLGATYAQMTQRTFLARLCALVPVPRAHTLLARVFRIDTFIIPDDIAAELHGARSPPRGSAPGQLLLFSAPP
ncbi:MAG: hypothetical protein KUG77_20580 [Nannocystaceae bacterium]|nr:hypothetical protein [Nannocystaceae bacterium]